MAIYELGISIDGVPGIYIKYYDFDHTYSDMSKYSPTIRQNIITAISLDYTKEKQKVHEIELDIDLHVYMYSIKSKSKNSNRSSYYSSYLISDEEIAENTSKKTMMNIIDQFLKFRPIPDRNIPIDRTELKPFCKTLDKLLKDSPLKPIDRLKKALFV
jgi:hypothetical protein